MGRTCCAVEGCGARASDGRLFRFPRTMERAKLWRKFCGNAELDELSVSQLHSKDAICQKHFLPEDYQNSTYQKLNRNAVPALYPPPSHSPVHLSFSSSIHAHLPSHDHALSFPLERPSSLVVTSRPGTPVPQHLSLDLTPLSTSPSTIENEYPGLNDTQDSTVSKDGDTCSNDSKDLKGDFIECTPSMPSNVLPCDQVFPDEKESEISQLDSLGTKVNVVPLNDYYRYTLCRLCFCVNDILINIFDEGHKCGFVISDTIKDLLRFKVSKADDFPQFICSSCLIKLGEFKEFKDLLCEKKETFEKSLHKLRKSDGQDENEIVVAEIKLESLTDEEPENSKDAESIKHLSELEDTAEQDFSVEPSEYGDNSESEYTCSENEDTAMEELLEPEAKTNCSSEVKDIILQDEYKCHECGEVFKFINLLTKHNNEHRKTWPLSCQYCDKRFKTLMDLNSHIVMHSDYKRFECEHCGLRCRTKLSLTRHKLTHSDDKPYLCSTCGMNFRDRILLRNHLRMHSNIKCYKCEECGKEFLSGYVLKCHYVSHMKDNPYVCGECGKSFSKGRSIRKHLTAVHSGEKSFKCKLCGKKFSLRIYLNNHMKVHLKHEFEIKSKNIS